MPKKFQSVLDAIRRQHPWIQDPVAQIRAGRVFADGSLVTNPASRVARGATITVQASRQLRGTVKLRAALEAFDCTIADRVALDIGASTGGFTIALLEAGARHDYALDAGHGQLLGSLRQDPRVTNLERTNLGELRPDLLGEPIDVVTIDLSYLAVADAVPQLGALTIAGNAELIALVKPTFELHLAHPPREHEQFAAAVDQAGAAITAHGWKVVQEFKSPILGGRGAREFFLHALRRMTHNPARPDP